MGMHFEASHGDKRIYVAHNAEQILPACSRYFPVQVLQ